MDRHHLFVGQDPEAWAAARLEDAARHERPWVDPMTDPIVIRAINETLAELAAQKVGQQPAPLTGFVQPPTLQ